MRNPIRFAESIVGRDAGQQVTLGDGATVTIPDNTEALARHERREDIFKLYTPVAAYLAGSGRIVYDPTRASMEAIEEEEFHAAYDQMGADQQAQVDESFGNDEAAFQAYARGGHHELFDAFESGEVFGSQASKQSQSSQNAVRFASKRDSNLTIIAVNIILMIS